MSSVNQIIKQLVEFYVKENYKVYLDTKGIQELPDEDIPKAVQEIYSEKKEHLKEFLKTSLKEIMKQEYIGDLVVLNICSDMFNDDKLCISKIINEIKIYQQDKQL